MGMALAALIVVSGAWAFWPSLDGVFVLDDVRAIVRNTSIRTLWPITSAAVAAVGVHRRRPSRRQPVVRAQLRDGPGPGGGRQGCCRGARRPALPDPTPFHTGNLLIHVSAALVLFGVVRRTLVEPPVAGPVRIGLAVDRRCRRPRLGRPPAADGSRDVRRAARGIADGALLPADALLRHPCEGRSGAGLVGRRSRGELHGGHGDEGDDGDRADRGGAVGLHSSASPLEASPPRCAGGLSAAWPRRG